MDNKKVDPPGWNDPPMLNYSSSNPPPKSRISNKRVAFPISSTATTKSQTTSSPLPPMPPIAVAASPTSGDENIDLFESSKCNLEKFFGSKEDELIFCEMWKRGKYSQECQESIHLLSKHLLENNLNSAQEVKNKLLLQFKNVCEPWLNNIRI